MKTGLGTWDVVQESCGCGFSEGALAFKLAEMSRAGDSKVFIFSPRPSEFPPPSGTLGHLAYRTLNVTKDIHPQTGEVVLIFNRLT